MTTACSVSDMLMLNHNAVALLANGNTLDALRLFQKALSDATKKVQQMQEGSPASPFDVRAVEVVSDLREDCSSPHNAFAIYRHAFIVNDTMTNPDEIAMVLLYNFALTFQIQGLAKGRNQLLRKSLKVYGLLERMISLKTSTETPSWKQFLLALWMNQGHIYSHFFASAEAEHCGGRILDLLDHCFDLPMEVLIFFHQTAFHAGCSSAHQLAPAA